MTTERTPLTDVEIAEWERRAMEAWPGTWIRNAVPTFMAEFRRLREENARLRGDLEIAVKLREDADRLCVSAWEENARLRKVLRGEDAAAVDAGCDALSAAVGDPEDVERGWVVTVIRAAGRVAGVVD